MKNLFIILFSLATTILYSQDAQKIKFTLEGNQPKTSDELTKLKLPIDFEFTIDFKDKTINILNGSDEVIALKGGKFGKGQLTPVSEVYVIQIQEDGKVNPQTADDKKIEGNKIKLKIGNTNPIILSFDEDNPNITDGDKTTSNDGYQPGYIYYDAIKLSTEKEPKIIKDILEAYGLNNENISNNPYLNKIYSNIYEMSTPSGGLSLLGKLGNTDVTNFAAGLARFLAERTKEELNEAFFNKMKKQLNAYPELKTLFPKTASFLEIIETYSYASVIQVLKEAFETDVQNLPENLYNIKGLTDGDCDKISVCGKDKTCNDYTNCQERLKKLAEFFKSQDGHWVGLGMFTVKEGIQSSNPSELLKSVVASCEFTELKKSSTTKSKYSDYNVASSIELCNFISQSLMSTDEKQIWINSKELNSLFTTKNAFKVYLGLLLAREQSGDVKIDFYKSNTAKDTITFGAILIKAHKLDSELEPQIRSLLQITYTAFSSANNAIKKIITATDKSVEADPQALYDYYKTFTASLKPIVHSQLLKTITTRTDFGTEYDKIEQILDPSVDIAYHISAKKYSAAIYDAVVLLNNVNSPVFEKPVAKSFIKYGTLISTVANAQSSDEVKKALDASTLPVGSYSIKRNSNWSFSINSYVGTYWNYDTSNHYPSFGLSAPIGFNVSKGLSKNGHCGSLGLNLQFLDIGALVNYYLIEGDTASLPNDFSIKLSNIFAPGFNISYNITKTPLTIAWGGQYIPTLYKYELINGVNELVPTNIFRWQASLLIDIPLFNLKVWDFKK